MQNLLHPVIGKPLQLVIMLVVTVIVRAILVRLFDRLVRRTMSIRHRDTVKPATPEEVIEFKRKEQRADSISQLLSSIVTFAVWSIALITMLANVGINVAPILASAGVVGVALGFGAQTLVKDFLAGIFMIIEDQYGINDLVDVGPVVGVVEDVGLRVTRLRDLSGVVWYVRNGEILRVANRSQGWTMAVVDVPVSYDTDLNKVRSIIEAVAEQMFNDPASEDLIIDKPEYAGVESMSGEAVVVRITARALPDKQVIAGRELRERIKNAFDSNGISVPVVLRLPNQGPK